MGTRHKAGHGVIAVAVMLLLAVGPAGANPQGGQVTGGSATIGNSSPIQLDIVQSTDRAVIDWKSFNIAVGERTQFHQPAPSSWTLNRVNAPDPSTIAGYLGANGGLVLSIRAESCSRRARRLTSTA